MIIRTLSCLTLAAILIAPLGATNPAAAGEACQDYGPQTPRDIADKSGRNSRIFPLAPPHTALNLCNVHFHSNAEHKGPGFNVLVNRKESGGYQCNEAGDLKPAERITPEHGACHGLKAGDTIEVHWVYSSCAVSPAKGLEACSSSACANPTLRVEAQVFLVVNDPKALKFTDFDYVGKPVDGVHQAKALPKGTGEPVVFHGSTTGPKYDEDTCSPLQATWSVRPACAKVDIKSLNAWCADNAFDENHAHGIRPLVTAPEQLAKIE